MSPLLANLLVGTLRLKLSVWWRKTGRVRVKVSIVERVVVAVWHDCTYTGPAEYNPRGISKRNTNELWTRFTIRVNFEPGHRNPAESGFTLVNSCGVTGAGATQQNVPGEIWKPNPSRSVWYQHIALPFYRPQQAQSLRAFNRIPSNHPLATPSSLRTEQSVTPPQHSITTNSSRHKMGRFKEYQVIGRKLPSDKEPEPKLYRMRIFAPNDVVAKSRFWYYLRQLRKVKKASGEIVGINQVCWS
jgi:hypothetical protein